MVLNTALWVAPVADLGGVARHFIDVARAGLPGWRVVFLTPEGELADELRGLGAEVCSGAFGPEAGLGASRRALRSAVKKYRPTLVHTHLSYADFVAALTIRPGGPKLFTTEHGIADDDLVYHGSRWRSRLMALAHHLRLRRFTAAIAVSAATKAVMQKKWRPKPPIFVVLNGVERPNTVEARVGLRLASIARLAPEKRIDVAIAAFAKLREQAPEASLTIAGSGPLDPQLRAQVARLGLTNHVRFVGHVPAESVLATSDVVVQLSVFENCSYTLLDAVANGLGVCATAVGGNPEILPSHCLVDGDDPARVVEVMLEQGRTLPRRPRLYDWPSSIDMGENLVRIYTDRAV